MGNSTPYWAKISGGVPPVDEIDEVEEVEEVEEEEEEESETVELNMTLHASDADGGFVAEVDGDDDDEEED